MAIWNDRIKQKRLEKGMTLVQIADKLGVTEATAQRYESGNIKSVPYEHMCTYAEILGCSPSYLMGWEEPTTTLDIFEDLLATTDWSYESYRHCDENPDCPLTDDQFVGKWIEGIEPDCCSKCAYNSFYYYLTDGKKYYKLEEDEFEELSSCLRPYLLFRISEAISKKNALSKSEYEAEEINSPQIENEDCELYAAHERTDIEVTDEMKQHDDDIMNDENF